MKPRIEGALLQAVIFVFIACLTVAALIGTNIILQITHCKWDVSNVAPLEYIPCEPVGNVLSLKEHYKEMARRQQCSNQQP